MNGEWKAEWNCQIFLTHYIDNKDFFLCITRTVELSYISPSSTV